jgi:hypothetical protein
MLGYEENPHRRPQSCRRRDAPNDFAGNSRPIERNGIDRFRSSQKEVDAVLLPRTVGCREKRIPRTLGFLSCLGAQLC